MGFSIYSPLHTFPRDTLKLHHLPWSSNQLPEKALFECKGMASLWKMKEQVPQWLLTALINWDKTFFPFAILLAKAERCCLAFWLLPRGSAPPAPLQQGPLRGCQVSRCCQEPEKSSGVPRGDGDTGRQTALSSLLIPSKEWDRRSSSNSCTMANANRRLVGRREPLVMLFADFFFFILTCCLYRGCCFVSRLQWVLSRASPLPPSIFLYTCKEISSSRRKWCNWRTVGVNKLLPMACLFSFCLQVKFAIVQNQKGFLYTDRICEHSLLMLIFVILAWPMVKLLTLLLSTWVPSVENACEMLLWLWWNNHGKDKDVNRECQQYCGMLPATAPPLWFSPASELPCLLPTFDLCWCFYGISCGSVGIWPSFWSEIHPVISVLTAPCPLLVTLHRARNSFAIWCRPVVRSPCRNKQLHWQLVTSFMLGIEQAGYKCVCFTKAEVGHSRLAESAAKDKRNLQWDLYPWDLYPCIQVAFRHPVTKGSEVMCPFLQSWCCKWSCLRLYIKPHYRYNLTILSSIAEAKSTVSVPCHPVCAARDFSVVSIPTCISFLLHNSLLKNLHFPELESFKSVL